MTELHYPILMPPLAVRAAAAAQSMDFGADGGVSSSLPGIGAVLAVLAAGHPGGRIAEIGTAFGVGSAWLLAGMGPSATLVTVEVDSQRATAARELLSADQRVTVITGRWQDHLPSRAPFDLVFVDGGYAEQLASDTRTTDRVVDLVGIGGQLLLDDLTPEVGCSDGRRNAPDPKRELALRHPSLVGAEFYVPDPSGVVRGLRTGGLVMTRVE